jgi:hypothetical protein
MKKRKQAMSLFSKEALDKLKKDRFSGRLLVFWDNGVIKDFNLKMNLRYFVGKRDDFFIEDM